VLKLRRTLLLPLDDLLAVAEDFTDRFRADGNREPTGLDALDLLCAARRIEYRLFKPRDPQTDGMVVCVTRRSAEIIRTRRFRSGQHLQGILRRYLHLIRPTYPTARARLYRTNRGTQTMASGSTGPIRHRAQEFRGT
jgi:hypothetical protein